MNSSESFHVAPCISAPVGDDQVLLQRIDGAGGVITQPVVSAVLGLCEGARSLAEHATRIQGSGILRRDSDVLQFLLELARCGFLVPLKVPTARAANESVVPISTVAIPTADRARFVSRALASLQRAFVESAHPVRLLIVDGSRSDANARETRHAVLQSSAQGPCVAEYLHCSDAVQHPSLRSALRGQSASIVSELSSGSIGANRNLILLLAAGERLVMVDDDVVLRTAGRQRNTNNMCRVLDHKTDPYHFLPLRDRADAWQLLDEVPRDLLWSFALVLGRSPAEVGVTLDVPLDFSCACPHILQEIDAEWTTPVAFAGICGDSGRGRPDVISWHRGAALAEVVQSHEAFEVALSSREALRITEGYALSHASNCMAYCMAIDGSRLLPPFPCRGRNEDGVFGAALSTLSPYSLFGHVPIAVFHDSPRKSAYEQLVVYDRRVSTSEVVSVAIRESRWAGAFPDSGDRYVALGGAMEELARRDRSRFFAAVASPLIEARCQEIKAIHHLRVSPDTPGWSREVLTNTAESLLSTLQDSSGLAPADGCSFGHPDAWTGAQDATGAYGKLLGQWPAIWNAARG